MKRAPTGFCAPAMRTPSAIWARGSCRCRSGTSSASSSLILTAAINPDEVPFWPWGLVLFIAGLYIVAVAALIAAGRREDARALAGFIPDCAVLVSRLARDPRISRPRRAALFLVLGYLALPIDLVPDFLPGSVSSTTRCCSASRCAWSFAAVAARSCATRGPAPGIADARAARRGLETNGAASRDD